MTGELIQCWYCGAMSWDITWAECAAGPEGQLIAVCDACWEELPGALLEPSGADGAPVAMLVTPHLRAGAPPWRSRERGLSQLTGRALARLLRRARA